jgi:hypothetical protein
MFKNRHIINLLFPFFKPWIKAAGKWEKIPGAALRESVDLRSGGLENPPKMLFQQSSGCFSKSLPHHFIMAGHLLSRKYACHGPQGFRVPKECRTFQGSLVLLYCTFNAGRQP